MRVSIGYGSYGSDKFEGKQADELVQQIRKGIRSDSLLTVHQEDGAERIINMRKVYEIGIRK